MTSSIRTSVGLLAVLALVLPGCGGGGGGGSSTPNPGPTSTVTPQSSPFSCPTTDGTTVHARGGGVTGAEALRQMPGRRTVAASTNTGVLAVTYDRGTFQRQQATFMHSEQSSGASFSQAYDYPKLGKLIRVLSVAPAQQAAAMASLRAQAGVLSVAPTGFKRYRMTSHQLITNDPYFQGFTEPQILAAGATGAATQNTPPYYEDSGVPGQWDMHAIGMENVFGYSVNNNSTGIAQPNALGTHAVKLAIIDTGEDTLHPELSANLVWQACFITSPGNVQSTSLVSTDPNGHGTDVSGIAAGVTNNSLGFASAGGNTGLMAYRVFPTPDDNCGNPNSNDNQCGADTRDIASAIDDAVTRGASVISLSLGGSSCSSPGVDSDPTEGAAVANAIAHNVVVVAAAGNESTGVTAGGKQPVDAPGCDLGVIAVGATSLDDGNPNQSSTVGGRVNTGTAGNPVEYVAFYSNAGTANTLQNPSSWGIVAPGGDPASNMDLDDLHWIENIWTSMPFMANSSDMTFAGSCTNDFPNNNLSTIPDCRTLIAGTSQATPHVAGVAAIICGLNASDCNPTSMKAVLCANAHDLMDVSQGCGRLNAYRAVAAALSDGTLPPP